MKECLPQRELYFLLILYPTLRIANIIEEGREGGPQKRIASVAAALKEHDIETVVILPLKESENFRYTLRKAKIAYRGLRLHRLGRSSKALFYFLINFLPDIIGLYKELRTGNYDLIHVSGGAWQFKGVIAGRLSGIPVIWHLNDTQMPAFIRLLFRILTRYFVRGVIVTSNRVFKYYLDKTLLTKLPVFHIQAPVDTIRLILAYKTGSDYSRVSRHSRCFRLKYKSGQRH